jgi:hypothetical protein
VSAARPGRILPPGKTRYPLYRRLDGPKAGLDERKISFLPGFNPRTVQPQVSKSCRKKLKYFIFNKRDWLRAGGSGDRTRWGRDFPHLSRPALGPTQHHVPCTVYNGYRVFPGGKERPGRDADPSPPSSALVKKV